jgi:hypothetical protein
MGGGMQEISHNNKWVAGLLASLGKMCTHLAGLSPDFLEVFFCQLNKRGFKLD